MFLFNLVFLVLLAASAAQSGIPRYVQGQWTITDENLLYEDPDGEFLAVEDSIWPDSSSEQVEEIMVEEQNMQTTPGPDVTQEPASDDDDDYDGDEDEEESDSAVWKIVLVVAVLLVSIVGSLSLAYYLCVWRGGRIHYQPQKQVYT
ncbi:hypothetical protein JOB18_028011 [Solea senegalensis]|uniref:Uncharacterized protein n=1 Tax=Solea senegalensis TaxID=28829 RepID=A0AAV6R395_SOLSE|nr:hypothetical protein JOB18_028011 [Solea senegalensis]